MGMKSCGKGHFYDERTHSTCPYCGVPIDLGETLGRVDPSPEAVDAPPGTVGEDFPKTRAAGSRGPRRDPEETVGIFRKRLGLDPVVGWLVCIEGPDRGRDYRVHAERNFIGRDATMDIVIAGDTSISCENHAVLSYNPKRHTFNLAPGDGRGLTYLTDEELLAAAPLAPYDTIELGASKLLFVPFCGERFTWPVAADQVG